jgi:hypothetical protein
MTKQGIVGFNQVFADARNEVLLRNILRARDGEPQQFSTVSSVNGGMRPTIGLGAELANLTEDFTKIFKSTGSYGFRNPAVTIAPLETKEFREGMLKPVNAELVGQLLTAGWPRPVVLHLVLAGPPCGSDVLLPDTTSIAMKVSSWALKPPAPDSVVREVLLPAPEATKMIKEGAGEGVKFELLPSSGRKGERVRVLIKTAGAAPKPMIRFSTPECGLSEVEAGNVRYRSPIEMIQYLGKLTRSQNMSTARNGGETASSEY